MTDAFANAQRPAVIVGGAALKAQGGQGATLALVKSLNLVRDGWNGFNVLHTVAARTGGLMLGYAQAGGMASLAEKAPKLMLLLGADEMDFAPFESSFKVYLGHHGDRGAHAADVILPGAAYSEKHGIHVNLEGRVQYSEKAVDPPGDAREDWSILRALSDVLGKQAAVRQLRRASRAGCSPIIRNSRSPAWSPSTGRRRRSTPRWPTAARSLTRSRTSTSPTRSPAPRRRCSAARPSCSTAQDFAEAAE